MVDIMASDQKYATVKCLSLETKEAPAPVLDVVEIEEVQEAKDRRTDLRMMRKSLFKNYDSQKNFQQSLRRILNKTCTLEEKREYYDMFPQDSHSPSLVSAPLSLEQKGKFVSELSLS